MSLPVPLNTPQLFDVPVFNAQVPKEGPRAVPIKVPFSTGPAFSFNLLLLQTKKFMSLVQCAFVDNSANSAPVVITPTGTGQPVVIPPKSQGTVPLLVQQRDTITFASSGGQDVLIILVNVPLPSAVWSVTGNGGDDYVPVAAGNAGQALGVNGGAVGDYLDGVLIVPATTSPGAVQVKDGAGTAITIFAGGAGSVGSLVPFFVPLNAASVTGAWQVITGANVSVVAQGQFT